MATTAETVLSSLETTIKAVTPTKYPTNRGFRLRSGDDSSLADEGAGLAQFRVFEVFPAGGEEPAAEDYHHHAEYAVLERYAIQVRYPPTTSMRADMVRIRSDVTDIKNALDDQTNWTTDVLHQIVRSWDGPQFIGDDGIWLQTLIAEVLFLQAS